MESTAACLAEGLAFERISPLTRLIKRSLVNPLANYLPAGMLRGLLRLTRSELAAANWADPGGWRSMVISYDGKPRQIADKMLVNGGVMSMALRNRRRLAAAVLGQVIAQCPFRPVHVLGLGAGPGHILADAMSACHGDVHATLVDLSSDAFDYGRRVAQEHGLSGRVRFIQGDVRDVVPTLREPCHVVKMLGICEYLSDPQIVDIVKAVAQDMPAGSTAVFNSLSPAHGTDRFLRRVFGLHMIYRSDEQLQRLFAQAGMGGFTSIPEPLGVYHVVVGRKLPI